MTIIRRAGTEIHGRRGRDRDLDLGQTAIEFVGVTPLIILLLAVLWQCALIGYTFSLAGNAADVGARAGTGAVTVSYATADGSAPPVIHLDTDAPLVADHPEVPAELALQGFDGVRAFSAAPPKIPEWKSRSPVLTRTWK